MGLFNSIKNGMNSFFREIFVWHASSLEFRAKLFGIVVGASGKCSECDKKLLKEICVTIYPDDKDRVNLLLNTSQEYIEKVLDEDIDINKAVLSVGYDLRINPRFRDKIIIEDLRRFLECSENIKEDNKCLQLRVIEYLENIKQDTKR